MLYSSGSCNGRGRCRAGTPSPSAGEPPGLALPGPEADGGGGAAGISEAGAEVEAGSGAEARAGGSDGARAGGSDGAGVSRGGAAPESAAGPDGEAEEERA
ncbi:hypothetical protein GCM10009654_08610 [Streptomyces hebeiensis]|uniref:Uncharacterized protein n=1 Tax=Streptomyces hebeiensis TaxID=229486 RepID=A0ABN1UKN1_9ACTN